MQFGVAAGQEHGVRRFVGRFVRQRRERMQRCARLVPCIEQVRIGEGERDIARDRDARSDRGKTHAIAGRHRWGCRQRDQTVEIDRVRDQIGRALHEALDALVLTGRHQPQMALGQVQRGRARYGTEIFDGELRQDRPQSGPDHLLVPVARDAIGDDASDANVGAVGREASQQRRDRMGRAGAIEHENDGETKPCRQIGGAARTVGRRVEQAHRRLDQKQTRPFHQTCKGRGSHRPWVEIDGSVARRDRMETRVDIVGSGLGG